MNTNITNPLFLLLIDLIIWWLLGEIVTNFSDVFLNIIAFSAALVFLIMFVFDILDLLKSGTNTTNS